MVVLEKRECPLLLLILEKLSHLIYPNLKVKLIILGPKNTKNQWFKCEKVWEDFKLENKIFCAKTSIKTKLVELRAKLWVNFDLNWIRWCEKFLNFCQSDEAKTFLLLLFVFSSRKSNLNFLLYYAWLSAFSCWWDAT